MLIKLITVDEIFRKYHSQKKDDKTSQSYQSYNDLPWATWEATLQFYWYVPYWAKIFQ